MALCTSHPPTSQIYFPPTHPFAHYTPPSSPLTNHFMSFSSAVFRLFALLSSLESLTGRMLGQGPAVDFTAQGEEPFWALDRLTLSTSMGILVYGFS